MTTVDRYLCDKHSGGPHCDIEGRSRTNSNKTNIKSR